MKQVNCNFLLDFTTEDADKLPKPRQMKHDLEELFAAVLDSYLDKKGVTGNEVHLFLGDELTFENVDHFCNGALCEDAGCDAAG